MPDWLKQLAPMPAPSTPAPSASAEADMPDWLKQLAPTPAPSKPASASAEADVPDWLKQSAVPPVAPAMQAADVPDWLKQPVPTEPVSQTPQPIASPEPDVPDWLKQIAPSQATLAPPISPAESQAPDWLQQPEPATAELPAISAAEVPDWLMRPGPAPTTREPLASAKAELPDWLKQLQPTLEPTAPVGVGYNALGTPLKGVLGTTPESPALLGPEKTELPDWLRQVQPAQQAGAQAALAPVEPESFREPAAFAPETETPAWMRETVPSEPVSPATRGPAFVHEPAAPEPEVGGLLPDWLKELEAEPAQPSPVSQPAALVSEQLPQPAVEMPDWLKELKPSAALYPTPPAVPSPIQAGISTPPPMAGGLVAAQIPSWLQSMRPQELSPQEPEKQEPVETEGLLAGVAGALQAAQIVKQHAADKARPLRPQIPAADLARAGALQELLARGAAAIVRRETESRAQRLWNNTQRLIVFLLVLAAVLFPLVQEQLGLNISWVGAPSLTPSAGHVYDSIDKLNPDSRVLVAVDYDATQSAEMDVQALVLLRHLAARKAHVQIVSLYPTGPAIAQTLVGRLNQTITGTALYPTPRLQVENRGYVPGQDMGIAFIQGLVATSTLVIELAATPDTVRWWAEQITAQSGEKPLLVGVSAAAEPMSLPYYYGKRPNELRQITGMLAGVPDATAYRLKLDAQLSDQGRARVLAPLASISLANTVLAVLMVVGALVQLVAGGGHRQ
jgi:hypothetical protein